jgi:hypothetical protein
VELGGDGTVLASTDKLRREGFFLTKSFLRGLLDDLDGEGDVSSSRLRFKGEKFDSGECDFLKGDSWFLNLENELGVLLGTTGRTSMSGVIDSFRDEYEDSLLRRFRNEYDGPSPDSSSIDSFGSLLSSPSWPADQPLANLSSQV